MSRLLDRRNWWKYLLALCIFSGFGVLFMCIQTYQDAPPKVSFVTQSGRVLISKYSIEEGQLVFQNFPCRVITAQRRQRGLRRLA